MEDFPSIKLLGVPVSALSFENQILLMLDWARCKTSMSICVANVHMLMEAFWDPTFKEVLRSSNLVTPDGMPLVRMMQVLGKISQDRVAGYDIFRSLCEKAPSFNVSIFLLGSDDDTLNSMVRRLKKDYPLLCLAGAKSLPFKAELTEEDNLPVINEINRSGAGLVFVALGCPKQEKWIVSNREKINATMLGLGYVFKVYAGNYQRAPRWMRSASLEWLYRLMQDPSRLWKRYVETIPPFLLLAFTQIAAFWMGQIPFLIKHDFREALNAQNSVSHRDLE